MRNPMSLLFGSIPSPPFQELVLGPLHFRMYGLCIALGVLASVTLARHRWAARGGDPEDITTVALVAVPAGLIGARLYHVITDWPDLYSDGRWWPNAFFVWKGGLGIPGGVLLGALAAIFMARRMKMDWKLMADAAAPALPIAQAIGRLGNYFNQELYGRPTGLPWGLQVENPPLRYPVETLFHPTFLYEGLWNLALAGLIVFLGRKLVLKPGRWFAVYILGYGIGRLWVESLRIDFANEIFGLRVNTWISLFAIIGGATWLFWKGNPVDSVSTAELRAGGDPLAGLIQLAPAFHTGIDEDTDADSDVGPDIGPETDRDSEEAGSDLIAETGPQVDGPISEVSVSEDNAGEPTDGINPEETA
ncbi:MAG: prolipoprotein diacylglyceryl transferase [Actinobacteria bacterium]|nr:prolipoprotein diacylglyceryl transferase [Actinomycetota bacterium]MSV85662.1 prolipoprotein diacylglyceryl transferase [Actinomycetota bacterium]